VESFIKRTDRHSLADGAADTLREALLAKRWAIGERIPTEAKLAEALGVSKGTLREAVRVLVAQGFLEVRQGSGTYVCKHFDAAGSLLSVMRADWRDQFEVRCALEVEAARLAAVRHTTEDLLRLHHLLDVRGESFTLDPAFVERDMQFHRAVVAVARNKALLETYDLLSSYVQETIRAPYSLGARDPDLQSHRRLVESIASGDPEVAGACARALIAEAFSQLNHHTF
jgi:DNA-binding FadR family transcriptional regulator